MNIILFDKAELIDDRVILTDHRADHIRSVLKSKVGDTIKVGMVNGPKGTGTVDVLDQNEVVLRCVLDQNMPQRPQVDLLLALPRPKVMKRLWAQLSAIGVGRIILTNAWKVERNYFDTHVLESEFYRERLIEGLQQAVDTLLPDVTIHKQVKKLVEDELDTLCPKTTRIVAHPGAKRSIRDALKHLPKTSDLQRIPRGIVVDMDPPVVPRVLLAVGPEGGWTDYEMDLLKEHGFKTVGMGSRVLRSDTACVSLLAVVHEVLRAG